jgi:glycyl-tRNA synthetase
LEDETVTIRHRDTMEQKRIAIDAVNETIAKEVGIRNWLKKTE